MSDAPTNSHKPTSIASQEAELPLIDIQHIWLVMRERWLGALALVLAVCVPLGLYLFSRPAVYQAKASLLVERSNDRVVDMKQVTDQSVDGGMTDTLILTHIEQMRSHAFLSKVVASLRPEQCAKILLPYYKEGKDVKPGVDPVLDAKRVEGRMLENLTVERIPRTLLISISVLHREAETAQFLTNLIADRYILFLIDRSNTSNTAAMSFLQGSADELRQKVEKAERELQTYREKYNLVSLEDNQNIVVERLKALNTAVTNARIGRLAAETRRDQVSTIVQQGAPPQELAVLAEFSALSTVQKEIDDLRTKRAVLAERYGRKHPLMQENERSLEALEKLRAQQLGTALADLRNQCAKSLAQERQLEAELADASKESLRLDQLAMGYNVLRREVETTKQTYGQILARQNETNVTSQLQNTNIKSADRAGLPEIPVEPSHKVVLMLLGVVAIILGIAFPLSADLLDKRVKSWIDVERYLDTGVLAEVRMTKGVDKVDRDSIVSKGLDEETIELFRGLYSQLSLISKKPQPKTILITSTVPGEGKSFVASNLAATFAAHGKKTLLVDGDFRRPSLHRGFKLANNHGLLTWLEGSEAVPSVPTADEGLGIVKIAESLQLLRTGGVSRRVTELIEGSRILALFERLQRDYDIIVIDTPPSGVFPDAQALARASDEVLFVCRFSMVERSRCRQVIERIKITGVPCLGVVLNGLPDGRAGGAYYSGYSYYSNQYQKEYTRDNA